MKKICAFIGSLLLFMGCCFSTVQAAVTNPFQIIGTDIEKGTKEFEVAIQLKDAVGLSAYEIYVEYDSAVLQVADEEGNGYFYTDEFKRYYSGGYMACNDKDNRKVIFAGANTGVESYSGNVAKIRFQVSETAGIATTIKLKVKAVATEEACGIVRLDISNPDIAYDIVLDEFQGIYGDVNFDKQVGLDDAQLTLKTALKISSFDASQTIAGDVDFDGIISLSDAQIILKKALKIIE